MKSLRTYSVQQIVANKFIEIRVDIKKTEIKIKIINTIL